MMNEMMYDDDVLFDDSDFSFEDDGEMFFGDSDDEFFEDDDDLFCSYGEEEFRKRYGVYFDDIINPFEEYHFSREDLIALVAMSKMDDNLSVNLVTDFTDDGVVVRFVINYYGYTLYDGKFKDLGIYETCRLCAYCGVYVKDHHMVLPYDEWLDDDDVAELETIKDYASKVNKAA